MLCLLTTSLTQMVRTLHRYYKNNYTVLKHQLLQEQLTTKAVAIGNITVGRKL
jgi:hypothetical protein